MESKSTKGYVHDFGCRIQFHLIYILIGKDDKPSQNLLIPGVRKIMFVFFREEAIKVRLWLKGIRGKAYRVEVLKCSIK